jgi:predicted HicB family RNase H-like nuclease
MPSQPKPRKPGRPKLPKGEAKGKVIGLRLSVEEVKTISAAAKSKKQTLSEWIRSTLEASLNA